MAGVHAHQEAIAGVEEVNDVIRAFYRSFGIAMMVIGALVGAATCGYSAGQNHPVTK